MHVKSLLSRLYSTKTGEVVGSSMRPTFYTNIQIRDRYLIEVTQKKCQILKILKHDSKNRFQTTVFYANSMTTTVIGRPGFQGWHYAHLGTSYPSCWLTCFCITGRRPAQLLIYFLRALDIYCKKCGHDKFRKYIFHFLKIFGQHRKIVTPLSNFRKMVTMQSLWQEVIQDRYLIEVTQKKCQICIFLRSMKCEDVSCSQSCK